MHIFKKKFNAQRSADRQFRATGKKHIVKAISGDFCVLPEVEVAPVLVPLPTPPDFSKPTHAGYRRRLAALVALAEARDVAGLVAFEIIPASSSRVMLNRYRNAVVAALTGQG